VEKSRDTLIDQRAINGGVTTNTSIDKLKTLREISWTSDEIFI
jgi:hypothetical protein